MLKALGNKVLLEKRINIRASDYRFSDKVKYYTGFENNRKQKKEGTKIKELTDLAAKATDFTESDIVERNAKNHPQLCHLACATTIFYVKLNPSY